jgi:hypothetical protein
MRTTAWVLVIGCVTSITNAQSSVGFAATVRHVHETMIKPASETIFNVGREAPRTKDQWMAISAAGATLVKSGDLLMHVSPPAHQAKWVTLCRQLVIAARRARMAAETRNLARVMRSSDRLVIVCEACHAPYRSRSGTS